MGAPRDAITATGDHLLEPPAPGVAPEVLLVVEPLAVTQATVGAVAAFARRYRGSLAVAGFVERPARVDEVILERIRLMRDGVLWLSEQLRLEGATVASARVIVHWLGEGPDQAARLAAWIDPLLVAVIAERRSRLLVLPGSPIAHHLERVASYPVMVFANRPDHRERRAGDRPDLEVLR